MTTESRKCAHPSCKCMVASDQNYCGELCKDAGAEEVEIACDCGHTPCEAQLHA